VRRSRPMSAFSRSAYGESVQYSLNMMVLAQGVEP
jgi:hypothetical protein